MGNHTEDQRTYIVRMMEELCEQTKEFAESYDEDQRKYSLDYRSVEEGDKHFVHCSLIVDGEAEEEIRLRMFGIHRGHSLVRATLPEAYGKSVVLSRDPRLLFGLLIAAPIEVDEENLAHNVA